MGNELLSVKGYTKNANRVYYLAETSEGTIGLRSSCKDNYNYAVVQLRNDDLKYVGASFHRAEGLAKRTKTYWTNVKKQYANSNSYLAEVKGWEVVALKKITAKEFRQHKRLERKTIKEWLDKRSKEVQEWINKEIGEVEL